MSDMDDEIFNDPQRVRRVKKLMEDRFGPDVTRSSLFRMLARESFLELYSEKAWLEETGIHMRKI